MRDEEVSKADLRHSLALLIIAADLPYPKLPSLSTPITLPGTSELAAKPPQRPTTPPSAPAAAPMSAQKPRTMRKDSLDFPEADPWGSPAMHRNHAHESSPPKTNGNINEARNGIHEPIRTTSTFTTASIEGSNGTSNRPSEETQSTPAAGIWGSYDASASAPFNPTSGSTIGGDGFDPSGGGGGGPAQPAPSRSFGGGRVTTGGVEENVVVTLLPEKEGMFMFQHHNYQVVSARRGSKVVRRYSDFVWLLDCLHKRYPFRQLPLLPPKRVGGMFNCPKINC